VHKRMQAGGVCMWVVCVGVSAWAAPAIKGVQATAANEKARSAPAQFGWAAREASSSMDVRADQKRDEAIAKLTQLLPSVGEGPQEAELLFRLSEMHWAKSKSLHVRAMSQWEAQLEMWHKGGSAGEEPSLEKVEEEHVSRLARDEAMRLYQSILDKYPSYERKDEVLYNMGSALYDTQEKKRGVSMYWTLLKQFPSSSFAPDAWLQLGEHFFNSNKLTEAVKAYGKAAETKKPRIYSFAMYKLAWCDYNLQDYAASLEKFRTVVAYARAQGQVAAAHAAERIAEKDRVQLMEEALSDMVRVYSHMDAMEDALAYYEAQVGLEKAYGYIARLARAYHEEGKTQLEIATYESLNKRMPYHVEAARNHTAVVAAYALLGQTQMVRTEVRRLIDLYAPNSVWAKKNAHNEGALAAAFKVVEERLAALVTEQHRAAQETHEVETYQLARDIYKEYLDKFTASANSYKFRFFYAEILFELKEFREAALQYRKVVDADASGEYVKPAAYTAVMAWEKVVSGVKEEVAGKIRETKQGKAKGQLQKLETLTELDKGKEYAATPLTEEEQSLADACDVLVKVAPKDEDVVKTKFKSARLYYVHNQFEEAAKRFGEIIDRWPQDALARLGAHSIVQSFNVRKDWKQLNVWARQFRGNTRLMAEAKFKKAIEGFVEGASFNEIHEGIEKSGDLKATADAYGAYAKEFPQSMYAMVALYNAVVNNDKAGRLDQALSYARVLVDDYRTYVLDAQDVEEAQKEGVVLPDPQAIREQALFLYASFYERLARFEEAAALYERYADTFKEGPKRADALFNAALFQEGLGHFAKAVALYQRYMQDYPSHSDVSSVMWQTGVLLEKLQDDAAVVSHFAAYVKAYASTHPAQAVCAEHKQAKALMRMGKASEASAAEALLVQHYNALSSENKTQACASEAVASAMFQAIEPDFQAYVALKLSGSEDTMAKNLVRKLQSVDALQTRYTQVLALGQGDYGIASLFRIGVVYQDLAQAMFATPCPKRLDEDQCAIYQSALQEKAFPLEEKAIEAYDKALAKAYELGLYNTWLVKTQEALTAYESSRFPPVHTYPLVSGVKPSAVSALKARPQAGGTHALVP
jgi:tetratricopeptide (TPR) repeat protein